MFSDIDRDASFSNDGRYRWTLSRGWGDLLKPWVGWIMLNPSTADASIDDPTIRRCMGYAKRWGYAGIHVANLFAYRATEPAELLKAEDPIAPPGQIEMHDALLLDMFSVCPVIIAAWGTHGAYMNRGKQVFEMFTAKQIPLYCLRMSKDGHPCHPLYLPADLTPAPFLRSDDKETTK
jgi:hypothetical protein